MKWFINFFIFSTILRSRISLFQIAEKVSRKHSGSDTTMIP